MKVSPTALSPCSANKSNLYYFKDVYGGNAQNPAQYSLCPDPTLRFSANSCQIYTVTRVILMFGQLENHSSCSSKKKQQRFSPYIRFSNTLLYGLLQTGMLEGIME